MPARRCCWPSIPPKVKVILQAIRIGELGIVANPCETFVEIGLEIKQKSPLRPTFTIELANGYNGYLPTPEQHALGGYETWRARSSYLEVNASTGDHGGVAGTAEGGGKMTPSVSSSPTSQLPMSSAMRIRVIQILQPADSNGLSGWRRP